MTKTTVTAKQKTNISAPNLYNWNLWLALAHAFQGAVILLLSATRLFPIHTEYLTKDPIASELAGHGVVNSATKHLFDINLVYVVAAFFFMAAIAHMLMATVCREQYESDLKKKTNRLRWFEYSLSASTMLVAVAVLSGVADFSTLVLIFVLTAVMHLIGSSVEAHNQAKAKPNWYLATVSGLAGIAPWLVFAVYAWSSNVYGNGGVPAFVYWIYATMFVLFSGFAVNMYMQYKKVGNWKDYLYGERAYMILSLAAKTILAWQIFAGSLRP
jgi:uncharacterized membrane protein